MPVSRFTKFALPLMLTTVCGAQNAPIKTQPVPDIKRTKNSSQASSPAPSIPDSLKLKYFKAKSEAIQSEEAARQAASLAQQKNALYTSVIEEIKKVCSQPDLDKNGDLICVVKK